MAKLQFYSKHYYTLGKHAAVQSLGVLDRKTIENE